MTAKENPGAAVTARGAEDHDAFPSLAPNLQPVKPAAAAAEMRNHELGIITMMHATQKPQFAPEPEEDLATEPVEPISIAKPDSGFDLNKFRAKRDPTLANVATLLAALPVHKLSDARDFIRLHPDEERFWSMELCIVAVPVKGSRRDTLHLIEEELALQYLQPASIRRYKLALGANPDGGFFLCTVPTQNLDNVWNADNVIGCEAAKSQWTKLSSRRDEGVEGYKIDFTLDADAFPEPKWPTQSLSELIEVTFAGRMISHVDHPGMRRLLGVRQATK